MIYGKFEAIRSLHPNAKFAVRGDELEWLDELLSQPTEEQINNEIARLAAQEPFDNCKIKAKQLIAACDWSALPDVGLVNQADFIAYRAALRALIINPVADPVWPTEPTPDWG